MKNKFGLGFSLAEALIVLLIVSVFVIVSAPYMTKKKRLQEDKPPHGKWACKYIDGTLHSVKLKNVDSEIPSDNSKEWEEGCKFPSIAKNVKYLWVEVYGGGGGGARGYATPWVSKTDSYQLGTPVPRDGEYNLSASQYNGGLAMKWLNADQNGIYYSSDSNISRVCNGNYFGEYQDDASKYTYANCSTYSASDKCIYTGDSTAIKTSNCLAEGQSPGTYCYKTSQDRPPNATISASELVAQCKAEGKLNCKAGSYSVTYTTEGCKNIRSLPSTRAGSASPGISGKINMKKGETVFFEEVKGKDKVYKAGSIGGYSHTEAKDGKDFKLLHKTSSVSGGVMQIVNKTIAELTGGKAGLFSTSGGSNCCTSCGSVPNYPNSSGASSTFCADYGKDGNTVLSGGYGLSKGSSSGNNALSIVNQYFDYSYGCNGDNGYYTANLFPASRKGDYEMKVGKGGAGAKGDDDNKVLVSAQNGEDSYFGWIKGVGGKGASDYCTVEKLQKVESTNDYNVGLGGQGGSVSMRGTPDRDYSVSPDEDTDPRGRWKVEDGSDGSSGMIVVSW